MAENFTLDRDYIKSKIQEILNNVHPEHQKRQIRDYPDSYFSDSDYELTYEQEQRIEQLESQIEDLEQQRLEKAASAELEQTPNIIKNTGFFFRTSTHKKR